MSGTNLESLFDQAEGKATLEDLFDQADFAPQFGGMGDLKTMESQMPGLPYQQPEYLRGQQAGITPEAVEKVKPLQFIDDVIQSASTRPINAIVQAAQDKGIAPWQTTKNLVKSTLTPFYSFENPIQSTETSYERAGIPNIPGKSPAYPAGTGLDFPAGMNPYGMDSVETPGAASMMGAATDIATPLWTLAAAKGVGMGAKALTEAAGESRAVTGARDAIGNVMQRRGLKQMRTIIKPLMRHERKTTQPIEQTIYDFKLDQGPGPVNEEAIFERTEAALNARKLQLAEIVKTGKDNGATVDASKIIKEEAEKLKALKGREKEFYSGINDIDEIANYYINLANKAEAAIPGRLDLEQAQAFKQFMGEEGAWQQVAARKGIPTTKRQDAESRFAEDIYHRLNDAIDEATPGRYKQLNREISELIPVKQAAGWRQIVGSRQDFVSLKNLQGMASPLSWPGLAIHHASKSGRVARAIYRTGEKLRATKNPAERVRYEKVLKRLGLSDEEIKATGQISEAGSPKFFEKTDSYIVAPPAQAPEKSFYKPLESKTKSAGSTFGAISAYNDRILATRYLRATTGKEPELKEVYSFLENLGGKPIPKIPEKPKIERKFNGRRNERELEALADLLRNGHESWPTTAVKAEDAPKHFTLSGERYTKRKTAYGKTIFIDYRNRVHVFDNNEMVHMDAMPEQTGIPPQAEPPAKLGQEEPPANPKPQDPNIKPWMKDAGFLDEDGQPLFQMDHEAGIPEKHADNPKVIKAAAKAWKEKGTDSPFFRRWFGESKAVGSNGLPKVMYHGTSSDFSRFQKNHLGKETVGNATSKDLENTSKIGFWFSHEPVAQKKAGPYTGTMPGNADMPVYLNISDPAIFSSLEDLAADIVNDGGPKKWLAAAKKAGHDGVEIEYDYETKTTSWVAFDPEQIKSATGNRGTFNPKSPNILRQDSRKLNSPKGQIVRKKGSAIIKYFRGRADVSTVIHELAHWIRSNVLSKEQAQKALSALGHTEWSREAEEAFARKYERYFYDGKSPSKDLEPAFATLKNRFREIYTEIKDTDLENDIPEELQRVFDAVLIQNKKPNPERVKRILAAIRKSKGIKTPNLVSVLQKELDREDTRED